MCVLVETLASGCCAADPGPIVSLPAMAAFIESHGVPLACVLVLGTLAAAAIELAHPDGSRRRRAASPPGRRSRAEAIGALGESLVAFQLRDLGWPYHGEDRTGAAARAAPQAGVTPRDLARPYTRTSAGERW